MRELRYSNIEKIVRELLVEILREDSEALKLSLELFDAYLKEGKSGLQNKLKDFIWRED